MVWLRLSGGCFELVSLLGGLCVWVCISFASGLRGVGSGFY